MPKKPSEKTRRKWPLYVHAGDASVVYRAVRRASGDYDLATPNGLEVGLVEAWTFEATYERVHDRKGKKHD